MEQPPFHNPNSQPLPDANDVEAEFANQLEQRHDYDARRSAASQARLASDKRLMRNFIVGLLLFGLVVGGLLSIGLMWGLNRLDLVNPQPTFNRE